MILEACVFHYPEQYRGIPKEICINFSAQYQYSFSLLEQRAEVAPLKNPLPRRFWDAHEKVYNASFLVGDNGSGKTTLLHDLARCMHAIQHAAALPEKHTHLESGVFLFTSREQDAYIVVELNKETCHFWNSLQINSDNIISWKHQEPESDSVACGKVQLLYLTNLFDAADLNLHFEDTSSVNRALAHKMSTVGKTELPEFKKQEWHEEAEFASDAVLRTYIQKRGFPLWIPNCLKVKVAFDDRSQLFGERELVKLSPNGGVLFNRFLGLYLQKGINAICQHATDTLISLLELEPVDVEPLNDDFATKIREEIKDFYPKDTEFQTLNTFFKEIWQIASRCAHNVVEKILKTSDELDEVNQQFDESYNWPTPMDAFMSTEDAPILKIIGGLLKNPEGPDLRAIQNYGKEEADGTVSFDISANNKNEFLNAVHYLTDIEFQLNSQGKHALEFTWGMSTGEENLLRAFSNLYQFARHKTSPETSSVYIFWDEADAGFHPDWQRQIIAAFSNTLSEIFAEKNVNIQMFVTTHSPLMLGDVPRDNVVYIKKENGETKVQQGILQTFGQNLYTILKDGFFLQHGTIGTLAQESIQLVLAYEKLSQIEKNKKSVYSECIGTLKKVFKGEDVPKTYALFLRRKCQNLLKEELDRRIELFDSLYRDELRRHMNHAEKCWEAKTQHTQAPEPKTDKQQIKELEAENAELKRKVAELEARKAGRDCE